MNAKKLVNTKTLSHEEWLQWRKKGIGGSDTGSILGFNKYRSAISVWLEKTGQIENNVEDNMNMKMGRLLEPIIADLFAEEHSDFKVKRNNWLLQHPTVPCMLANIDRELTHPDFGKGILEIKTAGSYNAEAWNDRKVPESYMLQLQHYLSCCNYDYGYFAVLIGGQAYKSVLVHRDNELINYIEEKCQEFWRHVQNGTMPEVDGSDSAKEALSILFPSSEAREEQTELSVDLVPKIQEIEQIKIKEKQLEERKRQLQHEITIQMNNSTTARVGEFFISWKPQIRSSIDSKVLKERFEDIYKQVIKQSESRPFLVSVKPN